MKLFPLVLSLTTAAALLSVNALHAQSVLPCSTDEQRQRMIAENPDLIRQEAQYELGLQEYLQAKAGLRDDGDDVIYVLPIVFHILYDPTSATDNHNVSDADIYAEMNRLNTDYADLNPDTVNIVNPFKPLAKDIRVRFQLATKDPFGNCTNGINRITTQRATDAQNFSKLNSWFRASYVNVWIVNSLSQDNPGVTTLGYSQLPSTVQDGYGSLVDGVIMPSTSLDGTTLTHELGHFLNLEHTWGNGEVGQTCGDDGVADTPVTKGQLSFCDLNDISCDNGPIYGSYTFDNVNTGTGTTDPTPPPVVLYHDTLEAGLTLSSFRANGVSSDPTADSTFSFSQWGTNPSGLDSAFTDLTGSINMGQYYEFTVQPTFGKAMTLTGLTFHADRSETGPRTFAVRSNIGGNFGSNLPASMTGTGSSVSVKANNTFFFNVDTTIASLGNTINLPNLTWFANGTYTHINTPVTFRIYAWNAEDGDGSFSVDSVSVKGIFGNIANTQNYMDYASCTIMFTDGQGERMRATLNSPVSGRSNLWTDANHEYTGISGHEVTCGPEADFYALDQFVCQGTAVRFKANCKRATATSWAWTFEGGNPATSTLQNPIVSFDEPGYHAVTLTAGNEFGSNSTTKNFTFLVGANYSQVDGLLQEPFNSNTDFQRWPTLNVEGNSSYWYWNQQVGHNAPGCAMLNASNTYTLVQDGFGQNNFHDKDLLMTPMLDLRFVQNMNVSFWYAYSTRTSSPSEMTENLKVYASTSCGKNWNPVLTLSGANLVTAGVQSPGYIPMADEWRQGTFTLPGLYAKNEVRLKFEYSSGLHSNDLYIDDVNIGGSNVGIDELAQSGGMSLMPNPASNSLTVALNMAGASTGTLTFLDMTGRTVYSQVVNANEEQLQFDLGKMGLTSGVYLVRLKHANGQRVERLVVR